MIDLSVFDISELSKVSEIIKTIVKRIGQSLQLQN